MQFLRMLRKALSRLDSRDAIKLSESIFFRVPRLEITLFSVGIGEAGTSTFDLSLEEARSVFRCIKSALENNDVQTVAVGDLVWTTDARKTSQPEFIIVQFRKWLDTTDCQVKREDVVKALNEFLKRFDGI